MKAEGRQILFLDQSGPELATPLILEENVVDVFWGAGALDTIVGGVYAISGKSVVRGKTIMVDLPKEVFYFIGDLNTLDPREVRLAFSDPLVAKESVGTLAGKETIRVEPPYGGIFLKVFFAWKKVSSIA